MSFGMFAGFEPMFRACYRHVSNSFSQQTGSIVICSWIPHLDVTMVGSNSMTAHRGISHTLKTLFKQAKNEYAQKNIRRLA